MRASPGSGGNEEFFQAWAEPVVDGEGDAKELEALGRSVVNQFEQYVKLNKKIPPK